MVNSKIYIFKEELKMSFKEELIETWNEEKTNLNALDPKKDGELFKAQMNRVNEIEKRLTELEKTEVEVEERAAGRDMDEQLKYRQMEEDLKSQKTKNRIEVTKIFAPLTVGALMGVAAMIYEKSDFLQSTTGKASWRDLIKFKL